MTKVELEYVMHQFMGGMDVKIFKRGEQKLHNIKGIYVGNEAYLPGSQNKGLPDSIIIEIE